MYLSHRDPLLLAGRILLSIAGLWCAALWTSPAFAQDAGDVNVIQQQLEQVREQPREREQVTEEQLKEPLGIVQEIHITGLPSTKPSVIRRQLSFKVGDEFSEWHRYRSTRRLYELGLFWQVRITYEVLSEGPATLPQAPDAEAEDNAAEESEESASEAAETEPAAPEFDPQRPLKVTVAVFQGKSYYIYPYGIAEPPYVFGAVAGDRDFMQSGKNISAAVFAIDDLEYYSLTYDDPQFLGGHHRAVTTLQFFDSALSVRTERNPSTGDSYYFGKDGLSFEYRTSHQDKYQVTWGVEVYDIDTELRSGSLIGDSKEFLLSEAQIPDGTLTYVKGGIKRYALRGYPLINEGYYWSLDTSQSLEALGSLETFGKYQMNVAGFLPVGEGHAFGARLRLDTTSGDIPHYESPLAGPLIRGYTGTDFYSKSTLTLNTEFRYLVDPELGQIVVFFDAGKGFDSRMPKLEDLEYGYGLGVRVRTRRWLPVDLVLYADYAWGSDGTEINVGIGQWF